MIHVYFGVLAGLVWFGHCVANEQVWWKLRVWKQTPDTQDTRSWAPERVNGFL